MKRFLCLTLSLISISVNAQTPTQTIKGWVIDKDTWQPLEGANVVVTNLENIIGTTTDASGFYVLENIPIGRRIVKCSYLGYEMYISDAIIVNSVKEVVLDIELSEAVVQTDGEVVVTAFRNANEAVNELSVVSTRSFSPEETELYAASVNDPGRMALSFPGVQQGADDNENDIIIRGNSSIGMLWRLEGIDIPNPNHFARPGTSGGGVTVFSAQLLNRSDFSTGAMPAEYGNAISGAFDMNFRSGNRNEKEYRTKIGLLGLDFMAEGPIKDGKSSYLVNYRYSTLGILTGMGVYLVGDRVTNNFQDLSYNLSFEGKDGKSYTTIFGIGGLSEEHYQPVEVAAEREVGVASHWEDRVRTGDMFATGITHTRIFKEDSFLKLVVAPMGSLIQYDNDTLSLTDQRYRYGTEVYKDWRVATALSYSKKFSGSTKFKTGLHLNQMFFDYFKEDKPRGSQSVLDPTLRFGTFIDGRGNTQTLQYYAQISQKIGYKLTANAGAHALGLFWNNTWAVDPRFSLKYEINANQSLSAAYGLHSQMVPIGTFFFEETDGSYPNQELEFMKSHHLIGSYNLKLESGLRISVEVYNQMLFNIPVKTVADDYYYLNSQAGYPTVAMESSGTGRNYGADLAVEKYFQKGFFMLMTGSLFESKYQTLTGQEFNTRFGTKYSSSWTLGKEIAVKGVNVLQFGARLLYNGGFRYTPHDPVQSLVEGRYVPLAGSSWANQVESYVRIDSRISYRVNKPKRSSVISLDIQNLTNRSNSRSVGYNVVTNELDFQYHTSGLVPVLSYQIDF